MEETTKTESHLTSAAAFVEGGIQDACDDACSICLEAFCDSDPSTVTNCKHEFHLQCILEWCQRSSQCPMCWQSISLKDPTSQELLEAVERERSFRVNQPRNTAIFHHPTLGDFELQHLPVGANDSELEERIMQHLAAAAAMGRAHHIARREGHRGRSSAGRQQYLVFSTHASAPPAGSVATSPGQGAGENEVSPTLVTASPGVTLPAIGEESSQHVLPFPSAQVDPVPAVPPGTNVNSSNRPTLSNNRNTAGQSSPGSQDRAGPSDFQSFSETLKSRFNAVSMRYKESITKSTRGWKERLFSRNSSVSDIGSEVRREVNAGIATVSRLMERLDTRDNSRADDPSVTHASVVHSDTGTSSEPTTESHRNAVPDGSNTSSSSAATSGSN
ncbi:E3 ubiquitin-protein ligase RHF2A [Acorus calamus]|uniref:RING-type E3 ubiquitin transferase n=1 Tax=Acorus calamus TaxID=4465 RepID=A0AAV9CHN0_ACOCL|nr:E3 ubiquitin-protein ligase RHF2A [Acorus calamus]